MTKLISSLLILLPLLGFAQSSFQVEADKFFKQYVTNGSVDYRQLANNDAIDPLVATIASTDPASYSGNARKAYLINAYNVLVIKQVLENYPLQSVLDINGFFDAKKQNVGGRQLTLNQLEKDLLLKEFNDARLHFVLVCGALGCPPIIDEAYRADQLEAQLNRQTRLALNDDNFIRTNGEKVELSQIFEWYAKDFGGSKANVLRFINDYRTGKLPVDSKVTYYAYDWSLNIIGAGRTEVTIPSATTASGVERYRTWP